jgi:ferredoxin
MSKVTFLSPTMLKERIVYVRGRHTILSLVRKLGLPLRLECGKGQCGQCAVKIAPVNQPKPKSVQLDAVEKEALRQVHKLSPQQYALPELPNVPPLWRLACRYVVNNDEDILVAF